MAWYEKLKSFAPFWVFSNSPRRLEGVYRGIAEILKRFEEDSRENVRESFIQRSRGESLELHARGYGIERLPGETDAVLRNRVRSIRNSVSAVDIKAIIDSLLVNGESEIIEDFRASRFLDGNLFLGSSFLIGEAPLRNTFHAFVGPQFIAGDTFLPFFLSHDDEVFLGSGGAEEAGLLQTVITVVNEERAFGTDWTLTESAA